MASFTPCGCDGVSVYVHPGDFLHSAFKAGDVALPLEISPAAALSAAAGGPNALVKNSDGPYVPSNLQTLIGGDGVVVTGDGGVTDWNAAIDLSTDASQIAVISGGKLLVPNSAAVGVSPTASADEALFDNGDGLSAGAKHYSISGFAQNLNPNQNLSGGLGFNSTSAPHTGSVVTLDMTNPSSVRSMPVIWSNVTDLPNFISVTSTAIAFSLMSRAYLLSTATPGFGVQAQNVWRYDTGMGSPTDPLTGSKESPLMYNASGIIPPGDTLRIELRLDIDWTGGGPGILSFGSVTPAALGLAFATFPSLKTRIDSLGSTI